MLVISRKLMSASAGASINFPAADIRVSCALLVHKASVILYVGRSVRGRIRRDRSSRSSRQPRRGLVRRRAFRFARCWISRCFPTRQRQLRPRRPVKRDRDQLWASLTRQLCGSSSEDRTQFVARFAQLETEIKVELARGRLRRLLGPAVCADSGQVPPSAVAAASVTAAGPPALPLQTGRSCSCSRSRCVKLYCDCFANSKLCSGCACTDCRNVATNLEEIENARQSVMRRNPRAFKRKLTELAGNHQPADCDTAALEALRRLPPADQAEAHAMARLAFDTLSAASHTQLLVELLEDTLPDAVSAGGRLRLSTTAAVATLPPRRPCYARPRPPSPPTPSTSPTLAATPFWGASSRRASPRHLLTYPRASSARARHVARAAAIRCRSPRQAPIRMPPRAHERHLPPPGRRRRASAHARGRSRPQRLRSTARSVARSIAHRGGCGERGDAEDSCVRMASHGERATGRVGARHL